jgi:hypothetical protein
MNASRHRKENIYNCRGSKDLRTSNEQVNTEDPYGVLTTENENNSQDLSIKKMHRNVV